LTELAFIKLGGSLLTDKTRPRALRADVLGRLAGEIADALAARPNLKLVIGHGSGSYGHVAGAKYRTREGVHGVQAWRGYAETALVAGQLNRLVVDALWEAGVPVLSVQPSASARCEGGELRSLDERPLRVALAEGLVPVVYGDVALDDKQGGTIISTEQIFRWLASCLAPTRIILAGEVEGALTADPASGQAAELIPEITPAGLPQWEPGLGGSRGVDVTGGMLAKVTEMLTLLEEVPSLGAVQIVSGLRPGLLRSVLVEPDLRAGTLIHLGG
jgi:isopentenyl phosphate kinase